jgi:hypothetical protein
MSQRWFVSRDKLISGPFSPDQLRQQVTSGELQPEHLVMLEGQKKWVMAVSIKGLFPTSTLTPDQPPPSNDAAISTLVVPATKSASSRSNLVLWVLLACLLVAVVVGCASVVVVWFFRPSPSGSTTSKQITSPEPQREEAARPRGADALIEPKEARRPNSGPPREDAAKPRKPDAPAAPKATRRPDSGPDRDALVRLLGQDVIVGSVEHRRIRRP